MKSSILVAFSLLLPYMLTGQSYDPWHSKKRLEQGETLTVEVVTQYEPQIPKGAESLIVYEIKSEDWGEEIPSEGRLYRFEIKQIVFRNLQEQKPFIVDSYYPPQSNLPIYMNFHATHEELVGKTFQVYMSEKEFRMMGEESSNGEDLITYKPEGYKTVWVRYYGLDFFNQHAQTILKKSAEPEQHNRQYIPKLRLQKDAQKTVITGMLTGPSSFDFTDQQVTVQYAGPVRKAVQLPLGEDGTFRYEFELKEACMLKVFIDGCPPGVILYMTPGDYLHINGQLVVSQISNSFKNYSGFSSGYELAYPLTFSGDRAVEAHLLMEYYNKFFIKKTHWGESAWNDQFMEAMQAYKASNLQDDGAFLHLCRNYQSRFEDFLEEQGQEAHPQLLHWLRMEDQYTLLDQQTFQLPYDRKVDAHANPFMKISSLQLYTEDAQFYVKNSFWYDRFLSVLDLKKRLAITTNNQQLSSQSLEEKFHFTASAFESYPKYRRMFQVFKDSYTEQRQPIHTLNVLADQYLKICKDDFLRSIVQDWRQKSQHLSHGEVAPEFQLGAAGQELEFPGDYEGKVTLLVFAALMTEAEISLLNDLAEHFAGLEILVVEHSTVSDAILGSRKIQPSLSWNLSRSESLQKREAWKFHPNIQILGPLPLGHPVVEQYQLSGGLRLCSFLVDKNGYLKSEWGQNLLEDADDLRGNIHYLRYYDIEDNPWLRAEVIGPVLAGLLLLPLLFILLMRIYRKRTQRREAIRREHIERELKGIRAQLNPHFLFNAMGSIQNLVNNAQPEEANHYLSQFSSLMRQVLKHSQQEMIPLTEEIDLLKNYLELEALRHHFQWAIEVDPAIDIHNTEVPSMMLQPYVENAILHGIVGMGAAGKILIKIDKLNQQLLVTIEDNGLGIENALALQGENIPQGNGLGMKLTQERMEKLGDRYGGDFRILLHDRMYDELPTTGTRVEVWIPTES